MINELLPTLLKNISQDGAIRLAAELKFAASQAEAKRKLFSYYPDEGPLRRELYAKHLEFFCAGAQHEPMPTCPTGCDGSPHHERLFMAANRVGKTEGVGGYETTLHATGRYPPWWKGHRFDKPVEIWAAGKSNETTRDIIQAKLFGPLGYRGAGTSRKFVKGTGLIPAEDIVDIQWKRGSDLIDIAHIRSQFGGTSTLGLKSYEQGRGSFEGTEKDLIWFDEEPPLDVYVEAGVRTMTRNGLIILTFTPMEGMSEVVLEFLPGGALPGQGLEQVG